MSKVVKKKEQAKLRSIALASLVKRQRPESGEEDEVAYDRDVLAAKCKIVATLEEEGVPRSNRTDPMLRYECENKGLDNTGVRLILLDRLARHDRGDAVMTASLTKRVRLEAADISPQIETHRVTPMSATGAMGLLGIPHPVIRAHIFSRVRNVETLFAVARSCKYLCKDALFVLVQRVRPLFNNMEGVTPLAYSFHLYAEKHNLTTTALCNTLRLQPDKLKAVGYGFGESERGYPNYRKAVCCAISTWGSIEGIKAEKDRLAERAEHKRQEAAVIRSTAWQRITALNTAFREKFGLPPLIVEQLSDLTFPEDTERVTMTMAGYLVAHYVDTNSHSWLDSISGHVFKMVPTTMLRSLKKIDSYLDTETKEKSNLAMLARIFSKHDIGVSHALNHGRLASNAHMIFGSGLVMRDCVPLSVNGVKLRDPGLFLEGLVQWTRGFFVPDTGAYNIVYTSPIAMCGNTATEGSVHTPPSRFAWPCCVVFVSEDFSFCPHLLLVADRSDLETGLVYNRLVHVPHLPLDPASDIVCPPGWTINHETGSIYQEKPPVFYGSNTPPRTLVFMVRSPPQ